MWFVRFGKRWSCLRTDKYHSIFHGGGNCNNIFTKSVHAKNWISIIEMENFSPLIENALIIRPFTTETVIENQKIAISFYRIENAFWKDFEHRLPCKHECATIFHNKNSTFIFFGALRISSAKNSAFDIIGKLWINIYSNARVWLHDFNLHLFSFTSCLCVYLKQSFLSKHHYSRALLQSILLFLFW